MVRHKIRVSEQAHPSSSWFDRPIISEAEYPAGPELAIQNNRVLDTSASTAFPCVGNNLALIVRLLPAIWPSGPPLVVSVIVNRRAWPQHHRLPRLPLASG